MNVLRNCKYCCVPTLIWTTQAHNQNLFLSRLHTKFWSVERTNILFCCYKQNTWSQSPLLADNDQPGPRVVEWTTCNINFLRWWKPPNTCWQTENPAHDKGNVHCMHKKRRQKENQKKLMWKKYIYIKFKTLCQCSQSSIQWDGYKWQF